MPDKISREEYIKLITEKYTECEGRYFHDCPIVSRRPQKRDIEAIRQAAKEKIRCSLMLKVIEEGSLAYRARYPRIKRIPSMAYFLKIARARAAAVPADPCDMGRISKEEDNERFITEVKALVEALSGDFPLPEAGKEALRESVLLIESALKEAVARRKAGHLFVQNLMDQITQIEGDLHQSAREGVEAREDCILWLRQAADAKAWLDRYERTEPVTTWLIVNHAFKTLGIPVNWIKGV